MSRKGREPYRERTCGRVPSDACRLDLLPRVIAGADERARFDVPVAHLAAGLARLRELTRRVVPVQRMVLRRWAEILAERQDVDVDLAELAHGLEHLRDGFAHAEDEPRLG